MDFWDGDMPFLLWDFVEGRQMRLKVFRRHGIDGIDGAMCQSSVLSSGPDVFPPTIRLHASEYLLSLSSCTSFSSIVSNPPFLPAQRN